MLLRQGERETSNLMFYINYLLPYCGGNKDILTLALFRLDCISFTISRHRSPPFISFTNLPWKLDSDLFPYSANLEKSIYSKDSYSKEHLYISNFQKEQLIKVAYKTVGFDFNAIDWFNFVDFPEYFEFIKLIDGNYKACIDFDGYIETDATIDTKFCIVKESKCCGN